MRHFLLSPSAITALTLGMGLAAAAGILVTACGSALGLVTRRLRAALAAVDVAPVAVAADHHLATTAGTDEQTCAGCHRPLLPMSALD